MALILVRKAKETASMIQRVVSFAASKETRLNSTPCKSGYLCGDLNPILTPADQ